jgi:hypothetical protein
MPIRTRRIVCVVLAAIGIIYCSAPRDVNAQGTTHAGISRSSWMEIGPFRFGGRIRSLLIDPASWALHAGSAWGGIWRKPLDPNTLWAPVNDYLPSLAVNALVAQPGNFDVQYAGTGDGFLGEDAIPGVGILRSTDRGVTWSVLASTGNANFAYVNRLALSADGVTLLAGTRSGIFRSVNEGSSFSAVLGGGTFGIVDVDFDPSDGAKAIAADQEGRAWYSVNAGATFIEASGLPTTLGAMRRVELAYAPSLPAIVYASIRLSDTGGAIYRSLDGGQSYIWHTSYDSPTHITPPVRSGNVIWVNPIDANDILFGGEYLYRTYGSSYRTIVNNDGSRRSPHLIVSAPGFNGTSNKQVYMTDDYGVHSGDIDRVGTWERVGGRDFFVWWAPLNQGLSITQFNAAAVHQNVRAIGGTAYLGTASHNAFAFQKPNDGWTYRIDRLGTGGFAAIDQWNGYYCYAAREYLQIYRHDGCGLGATHGAYGTNLHLNLPDAGDAATANPIAPFVLDPRDQRRILAGGRALWRTNDAQAAQDVVSWAQIKPAGDSNISAIAIAEYDSNHIWVGHTNGDVYKTSDGTAGAPTWATVDSSLPDRWVLRLAIDRINDDVAYVAFDGAASDNIWKTIDGGTSWTNIHGTLPAGPIRSITLHPANQNWVYVGTSSGVYTSEDGGSSWSGASAGPANITVTDLSFGWRDTLIAATYGRGVFKATIGVPPPGPVRLISPAGFTATPSPTFRWHVNPAATWYQLLVEYANGQQLRQWYTAEQAGCADGIHECQITAPMLNPGVATWRIQTWNPIAFGPWSEPLTFESADFTAQILSTYEVTDTIPGNAARLWLFVHNPGSAPLPQGSQAWVRIAGSSYLNWGGFADVSGLAPGVSLWVSVDWEVEYGQTPGTYQYQGAVWFAPGARWISEWSTTQTFNILAPPAQGARVLRTYRVDGAAPGAVVRFWALIRNIGSATLEGRVWFNVHSIGWVGSTDVSGLAPGTERWHFIDYTIGADRPYETHWYLAQVWNPTGATAYSPTSLWQPFIVGVNSQFTDNMDGWSAVARSWTLSGGQYLFSNSSYAVMQHASTTLGNVDVTARMWTSASGSDDGQGVIVRGSTNTSGLVNGYRFAYNVRGGYQVVRVWGGLTSNLTTSTSAAIVQGPAWNVMRVTANGSALSLSFNGTLVWTGSDSTFSSGRIGLFTTNAGPNYGFWVDYVIAAPLGEPNP